MVAFATVVPVKLSTKLSSRSPHPLFSSASCNASGNCSCNSSKIHKQRALHNPTQVDSWQLRTNLPICTDRVTSRAPHENWETAKETKRERERERKRKHRAVRAKRNWDAFPGVTSNLWSRVLTCQMDWGTRSDDSGWCATRDWGLMGLWDVHFVLWLVGWRGQQKQVQLA